MTQDRRRRPHAGSQPGIEALHVVQAYGSGVRTTLRQNATAYGFSVTITAAFGLVANQHPRAALVVPVLLFAVGASAAFMLVGVVAWRLFHLLDGTERGTVLVIGGAVDVISILAAVSVAIALARIPGDLAWPVCAFGTTLTFLIVGGLDILIARHMARRAREA